MWKGKSNVPGLNVSRSLGDIIAHSAGVSAQPEFTHTKLDKKDLFLILATDGVWEWTSSQEAVDIVSQDDDAESVRFHAEFWLRKVVSKRVEAERLSGGRRASG